MINPSSVKSLTPTKIKVNTPVYETVVNINTAINDKDILNIGVTGPYGSGKSSILKTLREDFNDCHSYLPISLATLKSTVQKETANDEELNRRIEYSILQQILYREPSDKLPNSRIKRIIHHDAKVLKRISLECVFFIIAVLIVFEPKWCVVPSFSRLFNFREWNILFDTIAAGYLFYCCYRTVGKFIQSFSNSSLNKLNLKVGEISIKNENSIFNKHLDEIIYFFQVTDYDVVIIEDLDRFNNTDILLKLRELNLILNSAHKTIGKKITFIYAIKDDLFENKDRTKFFDYIETVIPVINYSNSKEKLAEALREKGYIVGDTGHFNIEDIEDIAFFINDMRLLKNIVNEFHQYWKKLGTDGESIKLLPIKALAMITFKNFLPQEFVKLHGRDGRIYQCLSQKETYISLALKTIESKFTELQKESETLKRTIHLSQNELRQIYAERVRKELARYSYIYIDEEKKPIDEVLNDLKLFNHIWKNGYAECNNPQSYSATKLKVNINTKQIETQLNQHHTYLERLESIEGGINQLTKTQRKLEFEKSEIRSLKVNELCEKYNIHENECYTRHALTDLEDFFIQKGYIGEDYYDYISFFYDDLISQPDHDFILSVKTDKHKGYSYHLDKPSDVLKNMRLPLFRSAAALNIDLIECLISNHENEEKLNLLIDTLIHKDSKNNFLEEYHNSANKPLMLFAKLYNEHTQWLWDYCVNKASTGSSFLMVAYFMVCDKENLSANERQWLNTHFDLIETLHSQMSENDFNILIKGCHFVSINNSRIELLNFIIDNNLYQINTHNLLMVANHCGFSTISKNELTLTRILNINNASISGYLLTNLAGCIAHFSTNVKDESSESILKILNDESIDITHKREYLSKQQNAIEDLFDIENEDMINLAIELNIVSGSWNNVVKYYAKYNWNETLATYIDNRAHEIGETEIDIPDNIELINQVMKNMSAVSLQQLAGSINAYDFNELNNLKEFDADNVERLLNSNFSISQTRTIIDKCNRTVIQESPKIGHIVAIEYLKEPWNVEVNKLIAAASSIPDIETKLKLATSIITRSDIENSIIASLMNILPTKYHQLNEKGRRVRLEATEYNIMFAEALRSCDYISSYTEKEGKVQINTKRS